MKKFEITIETAYGAETDYFEVEDDATEAEIKQIAEDIFFNYCGYGYHEIKEGDSDE